jgi:hypothetical protein
MYYIHSNPNLIMKLEVLTDIDGSSVESLRVFELGTNEFANQYLSWLEEGNVPEEWNPEGAE